MKRRSIAAVILILSALPLAGCVWAAQGKGNGPSVGVRIDLEKMKISPKQYVYPSSMGVIYLASEQFLLCRKKDFCPLDGHFTPEPPHSEEKTAPAEHPRRRLSVTIRSVVYFTSGRTKLDEKAQVVLDQLLARLTGMELSDLRVVIVGYTDNTGSEEINKKIALERAEAVAAYFRERDINFSKIIVGSRPFCCFVAPNTTAKGRAVNRRAEIWVEPQREMEDEKGN